MRYNLAAPIHTANTRDIPVQMDALLIIPAGVKCVPVGQELGDILL